MAELSQLTEHFVSVGKSLVDADIYCVLSACLFFISDILSLTYQDRYVSGYQGVKTLDPTHIQSNWTLRSELRGLEMTTGIFSAAAWFLLAIPILKLAWIQSASYNHRKYIGIHIALATLALGGSMSEMISRILLLGSKSVLEWMAQDFNLSNWGLLESGKDDNAGFRTLEMIYLAIGGMMVWINGTELLFIAGIMVLIYISTRSSDANLFEKKWTQLGLGMALLSLLQFFGLILRLEHGKVYGKFSMVVSYLYSLILYPFWLLWLGKQLRGAEDRLAVWEAKKNDFTHTHLNLSPHHSDRELIRSHIETECEEKVQLESLHAATDGYTTSFSEPQGDII